MPQGESTYVQGVVSPEFPEQAPEAAGGRLRRITEVGEQILHRPCRPVETFDTAELHRLVADMFATMYIADGVGLAANQVGVDLRLFVFDCPDDDGNRHVGHVLNPEVRPREDGEEGLLVEAEGCLSVPGPHMDLARPETAVVDGVDLAGRPVTLRGSGYFARCLRHETDHLNGWLYLDRLSKRERNRALREMEGMRAEVLQRRADRAAAAADA